MLLILVWERKDYFGLERWLMLWRSSFIRLIWIWGRWSLWGGCVGIVLWWGWRIGGRWWLGCRGRSRWGGRSWSGSNSGWWWLRRIIGGGLVGCGESGRCSGSRRWWIGGWLRRRLLRRGRGGWRILWRIWGSWIGGGCCFWRCEERLCVLVCIFILEMRMVFVCLFICLN